jgi:V/A-type H+/Na+-transporting ATPase subunit C
MVVEVDYDYANARIKGMKSRLIDDAFLESLIVKPDLDAIVADLQRTSYQEELEKAGTQYSGIMAIDVALRREFTSNFRKILHFMRGDAAEKYITILLNRWDVQNIKTIIRGKNIHAAPQEILECLVPAGDLDEVVLTELMKQPDIRGVIDLLATWGIDFARPLTRSFKEFTDTRDLAILEYALDKFYYENALEAVTGDEVDDRIMREMLITEIDVINIRTVLKAIRDKIDATDAEKYLIEGGVTLDKEKLLSLLKTGTIEGAIKQLEATPYNFLSQVPEEAVRTEKISSLEKQLDNHLIKKGISQFFGDPLSIAIAVGYYWAKYREITNIRIVSRCKAANVPEKELRGELIRV